MDRLSRRDFLAASAVSASGLAATQALGSGTSDQAKPKPKAVGANDKVVLGFIGVGGMGTGLLKIFKEFPDVEVAAVCDVYEPHRLQAQVDRRRNALTAYNDFREVLDRKDIDAVVVATPDHWHAIPTILACQAGKDVYCEKPLSYRIAEGRAMVEAAKKAKRITQMGNLIHAGENYHRVVEIVRSGVLGTISKTRVWMAADRRGLGKPARRRPPGGLRLRLLARPRPQAAVQPQPLHLQLALFLGLRAAASSATSAATSSTRSTGRWRSTPPRRSSRPAAGTPRKTTRETPDTLEVVYHYAKGDKGFDMVWSQTDASSHGFEGRKLGIMFQGTEATLVADYNTYPDLSPRTARRSTCRPAFAAEVAGPPPRVDRRDQVAERVLLPLRIRPSLDHRRAPRQHRPLDGREAALGRQGRAGHEPRRGQPAPDPRTDYRAPWALPTV